MSYVEHTKVGYEDISSLRKDKYNMIANMINTPVTELIKKKCCDNCDWFEIYKSRDGAGLCLKDVANDEFGGYIKDSDTFYCSYHKFKD